MEKVTGADFKSATADDNKKLFSETYGCQMNVADSEVIASVMQMAGYSVADTLEEIAYDGVIDETEREDFAKALDFLRELENTITDMLLVGGAIKEAAPSPGKG